MFAGELRLARARAGLSQDQLSDKIAYSSSLVALIETGRRVPSLDFAKRCDQALDTDGLLERLHPLVAGKAFPDWFQPFVELERTATSLRTWEPLLVPGLLQTEGYAQAVLQAARPADPDEQIAQAVSARIDRQEILLRDDPPMLWAVIDQAVLRRPVGGRAVMSEQVSRLLAAVQRPRIIVQVIPLEVGANAGMTGAFVVASFDGTPDTVYLDSAGPGFISDRAEIISSCSFTFDTLRADAISPAKSTDLIRKEAEQWI